MAFYKGITDKFFVSPLKSRRIVSAHPTFDSRCEISKCNFLERMIASNRVFNEEIKKYIEKATDDKYTYQTVRLMRPDDSCPSIISESFYNLCGALRSRVAEKNGEGKEKVALLTVCPLMQSSHMITIEDTREGKFVMGEPWTGTMVALCNEYFFASGSSTYNLLSSPENTGLPISFIIKKGQEITKDEWNRLIDENFNSKS